MILSENPSSYVRGVFLIMKKPLLFLSAIGAAALLWTTHSKADTPGKTEPVPLQKANYELATHWTAAKVDKLVFDCA